jgi:hypothetical protein
VYGFCELGRVVQLKLARREVHDKATGKSKITAGEISCPPEVYYACVEGDAHWQRLPAHRSFAELSEARAERVKITNFKAAARRAARGH